MKKRSCTRSFGAGTRISHDASAYYHSKLYAGMPATSETEAASSDNPLPAGLENRILTASSEDMSFLPDNSVHLMVTSPPYNASKDYDADLTLQEYLGLLEKVFTETYRVLVDGGRACINVANLGRRPYIPLSAYLSQLMLEIGFLMRGEIIWNKGAGAGISMAWGSWRSASNPVLRDVHEYILVFSKGPFRRQKTEEHENTIITRRIHGMDQIGVDHQPRIRPQGGPPGSLPGGAALPPDPAVTPLRGTWCWIPS